jgi:hypothetical protein
MESFTKGSKSPAKLSSSPQSTLKRSLSKIFEQEPSFGKESKTNLKYISGPITWTGFEFGNKAIHLFGDRHFSRDFNCEQYNGSQCSNAEDYYPNSDCMTIDGLIKAIFETSDKKGFYVDFFMESPYGTKKIEPRKSTEADDIGYFENVYNYNIERIKSGNGNPKTKFHPIDIRSDWTICDTQTKECKRIIVDLFTKISVMLLQTKDKSDSTKKKFGNDILDLLQKGLLDYYKADNYILYLKNLIKNLSNWNKKTYFHRSFLSHLKNLLKHLNAYGIGGKSGNTNFQSIKMLESLNKKQMTFKGVNLSEYIQDFFESEKNDFLRNAQNKEDINLIFLLDIGAALMDISTLTKIIKRLEKVDEPQVLIVFAGNDHIKSYVKFFTEVIGLKPLPGSVSQSNKKHMRCLKDPNFSTIFGKWIETSKEIKRKKSTPPSSPRKSNRVSTPPTTARKSKQDRDEQEQSEEEQSEEEPLTTPRKSKRVSKPMKKFSKQYDIYY